MGEAGASSGRRAFFPLREGGSNGGAGAFPPPAVPGGVGGGARPFDRAGGGVAPAGAGWGQYVAPRVVARARGLTGGPAGIELRLTKHVTRGDVTEHLAEA